MNLVLCSDKTYDEMYDKEHYKYISITDGLTPIGYAGIVVLIHEDDCLDSADLMRLQEDMELLHDYRYLSVVYVDGSGRPSNRSLPVTLDVTPTKQEVLL